MSETAARTTGTETLDRVVVVDPRRNARARRLRIAPEEAVPGLWLPGSLDREDAAAEPALARSRATATRRRWRAVRRWLVAADVAGLAAASAMVEVYVAAAQGTSVAARLVVYGLAGLAVLVALAAHGLYTRDETRTDHTTVDDLPAMFHALTLVALLCAVGVGLTGDPSMAVQGSAVGWLAALITLPVARAAARIVVRRRPDYVQRTVVLGAGDIGQLMARKLVKHPEYGFELVGFIDASPRALAPDLEHVPVLGAPSDIEDLIELYDVERAIIAFSSCSHDRMLQTVERLRARAVQVDIVPRLYEAVGPNVDIHVVEGLAVVALPPARLGRSRLRVKRAIDMVISASALILLAPLFLLIAILVRLDDPGPVFYSGRRVGPQGRRFGQFKFRTMKLEFCAGGKYGGASADDAFQGLLDANPAMAKEFRETQKLTQDPRVTRIGRLLRKTSLDELPQLWNVLRGDLSLVGPRPVTEAEVVERYEHDLGYWDVEGLRPGLTGYWQISGRSTMSFDERRRLDTAYLTGWSLSLDMAILAKTMRAIFASRGAY